MKKILCILFFLVFAGIAQAQIKPDGVVINGVRWATCNVAASGTFAANPEDAGMLYQWNRKTAWPAIGDTVTGWDETVPEGSVWEKVNDPSPAGWRIPTSSEIKTLVDKDKVNQEWTTITDVQGTMFTDKITSNSIFLPAVGYRLFTGMLYAVGSYGDYWSSTQYSNNDNAYNLHFSGDGASASCYYCNGGFSVRCVADE
jgi:uncharacterized protein (TIGR02145 family)